MPTFRRRLLNEPQSPIELDQLRGLEPMKRGPASAVHANGDRVLTHGRRILATVGLNGAKKWHVLDAPVVASKIYPAKDFQRLAAYIPAVRLTPGHFVRATLVANPSGMTQSNSAPAGGAYPATGPNGQVQILAIYNNGGGHLVTRTIDIPGSKLANAAQPSGSGAAWSALYRRRTSLMVPTTIVTIADLAEWIDGVTVAVAIGYYGSPRAVDVVVYEEPHELVYERSTGDWMAPMHASPSGGNLGSLAGAVPVTRATATDAGGGAEIITDAARRLSQEIGPVLFFASSWDEGNQTDVTATQALHKTLTASVDPREAFTDSDQAYNNVYSGASISSGANARRVQESEAAAVLRDRDNVVPVRCHVYGSITAATTTAKVRFETASYSIAEVTIPASTSDAWHSAPGHLRCGLGAQDPVGLQVRATMAGSGAAFRWRYMLVTFEDV